MKIKTDFVTNSSATSYTICNKSCAEISAEYFINLIWEEIEEIIKNLDYWENVSKNEFIDYLNNECEGFPLKPQTKNTIKGYDDVSNPARIIWYILKEMNIIFYFGHEQQGGI